MVDFGFDVPAEAADLAAQPTLSHIGRYALKHRLAEGGLGAVYEAWDPLLSRTVAVKTLQFDVDTPARVSLDGLFLNEARTAAGLNHRYIVTVHDAGLSAQGVYIAMERLYGRDLRDAFARGWRPDPERAAMLARRVADALAYAHGRGVVHCDIKPANIFLTRRWRPKVLDFGIARAAGVAAPALEGLLAGSPHYLAPEQLHGGEVDARTDIYALGVVLYEMLAGRKAFEGESLEAITAAVSRGDAVPPHRLRREVPVELSEIALQAMALDPADRFQTASEFAQALRAWSLAQAPAPAPPKASRLQRSWPFLLGGLATMGLAVWVGLQGQRQNTQLPAQPAQLAGLTGAAPASAPAVAEAVAPLPLAQTPPAPAAAATEEPVEAAKPAPEPSRATPAAQSRPRPARPIAEARPSATPTTVPAAAGSGTLQMAISPWGQVEVNGNAAGTTPPLTQLTLPEGTHQITVRNADFPPYTATVRITPDRPAVVRHRFGS